MSRRIRLGDIRDRLSAQIPLGTQGLVRIGTSMEHDYHSAVGNPDLWPSIWVGAQRLVPLDDGKRYTGGLRQSVQAQVGIRIFSPRYIDGVVDTEEPFCLLADAVIDSLFGWKPAGAAQSMVWIEAEDGFLDSAAASLLLLFGVRIDYEALS